MNDHEDLEEETETLSLCDLPLYSSDQSGDWDQYSSLNSNSTSSSSQQDFFEFFTQELSPSAASFPPENIIFCGKLIPYKHLSPPCKPDHHHASSKPNQPNHQIIKSQTSHKNTSRWRRRWRLSSGKNSKASVQSKNGYNAGKQLRVKAKWYFFLFGVPRFSPVVELSDIRNRQSRRRYQPPPPPPSSPVKFDDGEGSYKGWGLWGLIRALSCSGGARPTAVAAVAAGG